MKLDLPGGATIVGAILFGALFCVGWGAMNFLLDAIAPIAGDALAAAARAKQ